MQQHAGAGHLPGHPPEILGMDWRVTLGLVLTLTWLGLGAWYVFGRDEWAAFMPHTAADLGDFLQGVFAPLAFLWLVLGHFLQQSEITANTRALELQELNTRRIELLSRRDSFFKLQALVEQQLGAIISYLYISVEGPTGSGNVSWEQFAQERQLMDQGDHALFIRRMMFLCVQLLSEPERLTELFYGTEIRTRHTRNFCTTFEKLLRAARDVDEDEMIVQALMQGSGMGRMYEFIGHVKTP
jgi:hypothetical protein